MRCLNPQRIAWQNRCWIVYAGVCAAYSNCVSRFRRSFLFHGLRDHVKNFHHVIDRDRDYMNPPGSTNPGFLQTALDTLLE